MIVNMGDVAPRIMFLATADFVFPVQLARSFSDAGCEIATVSVSYSPLQRIQCAAAKFNLPPFRPQSHLSRAMEAWQPHLVVPCDDDAAQLLYSARFLSSHKISSVIEKSQGSMEGFSIASSKRDLMNYAARLGIDIPKTQNLDKRSELSRIRDFPCVIKRDRTFGGQGVTFARSHKEAAEALRMSPRDIASLLRKAGGCLKRKRYWQLRQFIKPQSSNYIVQQAIAGADANRLVFCLNGRVLAGISVEVERAKHDHGPAAIVRFSDNQQMIDSSSLLVDKLGLSGFYGFDFIIERTTGRAYLLEINPRATQIGHLTNSQGVNLVRSACNSIGWISRRSMARIETDYVALFPAGTYIYESESGIDGSAFFDIPWDESAMMDDEIRKDSSGKLREFVNKCRETQTLLGHYKQRQQA